MILKGIAAAKGKARGAARIYTDGAINNGEILITKTTTPAMSINMLKAAAVVTETGGMLSHAAIFCRELGLPCVVGVKEVLQTVNEGTLIEVNGEEGTVTILKQ